MTTFAAIFEEVLLLMSIHNIFGIPFRIVSCSGEAVSQFYKPLQESPLSDLCATMDGGDPTNVAQIIFKNETNHLYVENS